MTGPSPALAALNAEKASKKAKSRELQAAAKAHAARELIALRRELFAQWSGRDDLWPQQSPADQRAWDRLAEWIERRQAVAIAEVVALRDGMR